jgi:hypothetical protein
MPRTKKPPGQAVDRRNGRRAELEGQALEKFPLPVKRPAIRTRRVWAALWDDPVSSVLALVDREMVIRWITSTDAWITALGKAELEPVSRGSMGQEVPSPFYAIAKQHLDEIEKCEQQLGVGALNRARLGLTITTARRSLDDLNRDFLEAGDEPDPRLG